MNNKDPAAPEYSGIESEEEALTKNLFKDAFLIVALPCIWVWRKLKGGELAEAIKLVEGKRNTKVVEAKKIRMEMKTFVYEMHEVTGTVLIVKYNRNIAYLNIEVSSNESLKPSPLRVVFHSPGSGQEFAD